MFLKTFELLLILLVLTITVLECSSTDPKKTTVNIEIKTVTQYNTVSLDVYDSNLSSLGTAVTGNSIKIPANAGKYYVRVSGDVGDYGLWVQAENLKTTINPGSIMSQSLELFQNIPQKQTFQRAWDSHWYKINWQGNSSSAFEVSTFSYQNSNLRTDMALYNSNGVKLLSGSLTSTSWFQQIISSTGYPSGIYYVFVSSDLAGDYGICFNEYGLSVPPDPPSVSTNSFPCSIGIIQPQRIDFTNDEDFFFFQVIDKNSSYSGDDSHDVLIIYESNYASNGGCSCNGDVYNSEQSSYTGDSYAEVDTASSGNSSSSGGCCGDSNASSSDSSDSSSSSGGCCGDSDSSSSDSSSSSSGGCCGDSGSDSGSSSSSSGGCCGSGGDSGSSSGSSGCGSSSSGSGGGGCGGGSTATLTKCDQKAKAINNNINYRKKVIGWLFPWVIVFGVLITLRMRFKRNRQN